MNHLIYSGGADRMVQIHNLNVSITNYLDTSYIRGALCEKRSLIYWVVVILIEGWARPRPPFRVTPSTTTLMNYIHSLSLPRFFGYFLIYTRLNDNCKASFSFMTKLEYTTILTFDFDIKKVFLGIYHSFIPPVHTRSSLLRVAVCLSVCLPTCLHGFPPISLWAFAINYSKDNA